MDVGEKDDARRLGGPNDKVFGALVRGPAQLGEPLVGF
jgi:hypothetical protein